MIPCTCINKHFVVMHNNLPKKKKNPFQMEDYNVIVIYWAYMLSHLWNLDLISGSTF